MKPLSSIKKAVLAMSMRFSYDAMRTMRAASLVITD